MIHTISIGFLLAFFGDLVLSEGPCKPNNHLLFLIQENGKKGYIDVTGKEVIKPIFLEAGEFSDGLAYARISGKYGYINQTGQFAIPPAFDHASPFSDGRAIVYNGDKPMVINTMGLEAFPFPYESIEPYSNKIAYVRTHSNNAGIIDTSGNLIIDTLFSRIFPFVKGLAVVQGMQHDEESGIEGDYHRTYEVGVIDTAGNFRIPYGLYKDIGGLMNNYFLATLPFENPDPLFGYDSATAILDIKGDVLLTRPNKTRIRIGDVPRCGMIVMSLYKYWIPEEKGILSSSRKSYKGFMNLQGELVFNDTTYKDVTRFSNHRAFVTQDRLKYRMINERCEFIPDKTFEEVPHEGFTAGLAIVRQNGLEGIIDTTGNFIIRPKYSQIHYPGVMGNIFFFSLPSDDEASSRLIGIGHLNGTTIMEPKMNRFHYTGFVNGLLKCWIDDKLTYVDPNGNIVWQESSDPRSGLMPYNIVRTSGSDYTAYSKPQRKNRSGGWYASDNYPRRLERNADFQEDLLNVKIYQEELDTFQGKYIGMVVKVANLTKTKILFNAQDSRIDMRVQALDTSGQWRDIEVMFNSWCGNSYHRLELKPDYYWSFVTPVYEGDFETILRIQLEYIEPSRTYDYESCKKVKYVYSNEYPGSLNLSQFVIEKS